MDCFLVLFRTFEPNKYCADPAVHKADQTVEEATLEKVNIFLILLNQETKVEKEKDSVTTIKQVGPDQA